MRAKRERWAATFLGIGWFVAAILKLTAPSAIVTKLGTLSPAESQIAAIGELVLAAALFIPRSRRSGLLASGLLLLLICIASLAGLMSPGATCGCLGAAVRVGRDRLITMTGLSLLVNCAGLSVPQLHVTQNEQ